MTLFAINMTMMGNEGFANMDVAEKVIEAISTILIYDYITRALDLENTARKSMQKLTSDELELDYSLKQDRFFTTFSTSYLSA